MSTNNWVVADIWLLTVSWTLTCEMIQIRNFYCFVYRQHIYMTWEMRGDCLATSLIMLGFMDLGWPRVCRRPTSVLLWFDLFMKYEFTISTFPFRRIGKLSIWPHPPGPWFNIKMTSYQYRKSHCGDKTILRPSYLHNGISYTGKMTSLY